MNERTLRFSAEPSRLAPRRARNELRQWLEGVACTDRVKDDAVLTISELVTHAVVDARSSCDVIASFADGRLRLEVHDHQREPPAPHTLDGDDGEHRWPLVAAVVDAWGWQQTATGRFVWTETLC